jgi:hypothetical protein
MALGQDTRLPGDAAADPRRDSRPVDYPRANLLVRHIRSFHVGRRQL